MTLLTTLTWCEWAFIVTGGFVLLIVLAGVAAAAFVHRTLRHGIGKVRPE